jgi:nitric oxide reductase subunit C
MYPQKNIRTFIVILLTTAALVILSACSSEQSASPADPSGVDLELGQRMFQANCSSCHSTEKDMVLVGPSIAGLASRAGNTVAGLDAEAYIRQSILEPEAYQNEGFPSNIMPATYGQQLSEEDINALVSYLLTFE